MNPTEVPKPTKWCGGSRIVPEKQDEHREVSHSAAGEEAVEFYQHREPLGASHRQEEVWPSEAREGTAGTSLENGCIF